MIRYSERPLIHFACSLFETKSSLPKSSVLFKASKLAPETLDTLACIIRDGTLGQLCAEWGWPSIEVASEDSDSIQKLRMWHPTRWQGRSLSFSEQSIELLLAFFGLDPEAKQSKRFGRIEPKTNGDLLAHFFMTKRMYSRIHVLPAYQEILHRNALTALHSLYEVDGQLQAAAFRLLFSKKMEPLFPWLSRAIAQSMARQESYYWKSLSRVEFKRSRSIQCGSLEVAREVIDAKARKSADLLVGVRFARLFIDFYRAFQRYCWKPKLWERSLLRMKFKRLEDRQKAVREWRRIFDGAYWLRDLAQQIHGLHPIDREAEHRLFLQHYRDSKLEAFIARSEAFQSLELPSPE